MVTISYAALTTIFGVLFESCTLTQCIHKQLFNSMPNGDKYGLFLSEQVLEWWKSGYFNDDV